MPLENITFAILLDCLLKILPKYLWCRNKNDRHYIKVEGCLNKSLVSQKSALRRAICNVLLLKQELSVYGYPSIQAKGFVNKITLLNVTYDLLKNYRKSLEAHSQTVDDLKNYESDAARSQHMLSLAKVNVLSQLCLCYCIAISVM